jgi:hypothetical protein
MKPAENRGRVGIRRQLKVIGERKAENPLNGELSRLLKNYFRPLF